MNSELRMSRMLRLSMGFIWLGWGKISRNISKLIWPYKFLFLYITFSARAFRAALKGDMHV
jgi:hypothetical protein